MAIGEPPWFYFASNYYFLIILGGDFDNFYFEAFVSFSCFYVERLRLWPGILYKIESFSIFLEDSILFLALSRLPSMLPLLEPIVYYISNLVPAAIFSSTIGDYAPFLSSFLGVPVAIK